VITPALTADSRSLSLYMARLLLLADCLAQLY
jgi:hypothetical protein